MTSTDRQRDGRAPAAVPLPGEPGLSVPPAVDPGPGSPPQHRCGCGHLEVFHDLPKRKAGYVRTGCSWTTGPQLTPCGCQLYEEAACS